MTRLVARLVLAMLTLPIAGAVMVAGIVFIMAVAPAQGGPEFIYVAGLWGAVYTVTGVYWVLVWRSSVVWTRRRIIGTWLAAPGALTVGALFGTIIWSVAAPLMGGREALVFCTILGGGVPPIAWVLATVLLWRETTQERLARVQSSGAEALVCPACGYSMVGQREAACPECGASYTLDALVAAQPKADATHLEKG